MAPANPKKTDTSVTTDDSDPTTETTAAPGVIPPVTVGNPASAGALAIDQKHKRSSS
jgi:hypothetical protein